MSGVGRKREPISLLLIKGKKHLTKAEIEQRQEQEASIKVKTDRVTAPGYLPKELKLEFNRIAKELLRIGIISNLDVDTLAKFILSREQYVRLATLMREYDPVEDYFIYSKLVSNSNSLFNQCRAVAQDLGLSITARCKLLVPKDKSKKEPSEFDRKFGDV